MSVAHTQIWVNGKPDAPISAYDRGLQYGDGFFTTLLAADGQVFNWSAHWRRLSRSAERLGFPALNETHVWRQAETVLRESENLSPQVMKLIFSRGKGGAGYQPPSVPQVNLIVQLSGHPLWERIEQMGEFPEPALIRLCQTCCGIQPQLAGLKHLNRLENVIARMELMTGGEPEGLMLNHQESVICGTQSNLFLIQGNTVLTPKIDLSGVEGTTRYQLRNAIETLGLKWKERRLTLKDIESADELFLTNAVRGVLPVSRLRGAGLDDKIFNSEQTREIHQVWYEWQRLNAKQVIPC